MTGVNRCDHCTTIDSESQIKIEALRLPPAGDLFRELRAFLYRFQQSQNSTFNNVYGLLTIDKDTPRRALVNLGPSFDKGETTDHFRFDSGARLSFGITLAADDRESRLLGYRFHYVAPDGKSPTFIRFDLNRELHSSPLMEPLCHMHPGHDDIRLPSVVMHPLHVLEVVLYVVHPQFS
jgi:hypothetical protein